MSAWRPALRMAWRDALRARGRTALVLTMVALPVAGVVAGDTLIATGSRTSTEYALDRVGGAAALVERAGTGSVVQSPDGTHVGSYAEAAGGGPPRPATTEDVRAVLPAGARVLPLRRGTVEVRTALGPARPSAVELDVTDEALGRLFTLTAGRLPRARGEVATTPALARRGFRTGDALPLAGGRTLRVVGTATFRDAVPARSGVLALPGTLPGGDLGEPEAWYVTGTDVDWGTVQRANERGLLVLSQAVLRDPPPPSQVDPQARHVDGPSDEVVAVVVLIALMSVLQVALLAGPAFALGARRQRRALALLAATGGTPRDVRRVVLAQALVLGSVASVGGAALGLGAAAAAGPVVARLADSASVPLDVEPLHVAVVAVLGLLSAVVAALLPAVAASRDDVVAGLTGRRAAAAGPLRTAVAGGLLLALGVVLAVAGTGRTEVFVAFSAVPTVLGAVLLAPAAVAGLGRLGPRLPLAARFAVRDAARQRSRTAPAVAAVAATVAGVVALGTGASSDHAEQQALYGDRGRTDLAVVTAHGETPAPWSTLEAAVRRAAPGVPVTAVRGVPDPWYEHGRAFSYDRVQVCPDDGGGPLPHGCSFAGSYSSDFGTSVLVGAESLDVLDLTAAQRRAGAAVLARGGAVVFADQGTGTRRVAVSLTRSHVLDTGEERTTELARRVVPALLVPPPAVTAPAQAVVSRQTADALGARPTTTALVLDADRLTPRLEGDVRDAVGGLVDGAVLQVTRPDGGTRLVLLVLGAVAALLVLGGTTVATRLALAEARPDLVTLGAVGAAPRTRRAVGAWYAGVLGVLGAAIGTVAGLVPGIAVAYPLTGAGYGPSGPGQRSVYVDVPWLLLLALAVVVPLVAAAASAAATGGRLPAGRRVQP